MPDERFLHFKDFSSSSASMEERKRIWLDISDMTEPDFDAMMAQNKSRQSGVPKVGDAAPDFEIERLTRDRARTSEYVELSALRGRPVALCFGSYT